MELFFCLYQFTYVKVSAVSTLQITAQNQLLHFTICHSPSYFSEGENKYKENLIHSINELRISPVSVLSHPQFKWKQTFYFFCFTRALSKHNMTTLISENGADEIINEEKNIKCLHNTILSEQISGYFKI